MKANTTNRKFTPAHIAQAKEINLTPLLNQRPSVRGITIDDATTVDRDDGIWLEEKSNGNLELQVSITDIAEIVEINSPIDQEALKRVVTLYHTHPPTPMLPVNISTNLGSLNQGETRLTITVFFELSPQGEIISSRIEETKFHSLKAFSYKEVEEILRNPSNNQEELLLIKIQQIAQKFAKNRRGKSGTLTAEGYIDEDGNLIKNNINTQQLIAELMILTNTTIANLLAQEKIPAIYRTQDVGIADLTQAVKEMGHCLVPAIYEVEAKSHIGLGIKAYCHFTSPLRRFVDLVNHRIIKAFINNKKQPYQLEELIAIATEINDFYIQLKQSLENYLKTKHRQQQTAKYANISDQEIEQLSSEKFSELIEYTVIHGDINTLIIHLENRLKDLKPKDFYYLWFVGKLNLFFDVDNIDAISILLVASQIKQINIDYYCSFNGAKKIHSCYCFIDGLTTKLPAQDSRKTQAKHQSALKAIQSYINDELVSKPRIFDKVKKSQILETELSANNKKDDNSNIKDFSQFLTKAIDENNINDEILTQIDSRIDKLQPKDLYYLWFKAKINRWFDVDSLNAVSVLVVRSQLDNVTMDYHIEYDQKNACYIASCYVDGLTSSERQADKKKMKAKQKSAMAYIESYLLDNLTPNPASVKLITQNLTENELVESENNGFDGMSWLNDFCQKLGIDYPEDEYYKIASFYRCDLTCQYGGNILKSQGFGNSKKNARQCASRVMIIQHNLTSIEFDF
ncbi:MAG: RNB domain-containing ribonuclease [Cyanobacterium sp. T60_A2020_053]|nr:RNB domain-containing ribonuclease [Cyanobacterium sp. T60_A2020_053]